MKKIVWIFALLAGLQAQAQDLRTCFEQMPDSLSLLLTKVNREDFGDFLESHMKAEVKNRFGKMSEMQKLTPDYLCLKLSASSQVEMKLLPLNDSVKVICVAHTYLGPVADSKVSFYTTGWEELAADRFLQLPTEGVFYKPLASPADEETLRNLRVKADMFLCKAQLAEADATLSLSYTTPEYLDESTVKQLKPYLRSTPIIYRWKDGCFVKE